MKYFGRIELRELDRIKTGMEKYNEYIFVCRQFLELTIFEKE